MGTGIILSERSYHALIAHLDSFPSFFHVSLYLFIVQRLAMELRNVSGENDRKK